MKQKEDFLAEIIAEPDADAPRLIYADWLEENGIDPARAEFIRIQCELAKTPPCPRTAELREKLEAAYTDLNITGRFITFIPSDSESITVANYCACMACRLGRREEELLTAHAATKWLFDLPPGLRPILPDAQKKAFHRGFIAEITLPCADWIAHREEILRMCPLEKVTVTRYAIESTFAKAVADGVAHGANIYPTKHDYGNYYPPLPTKVKDGELFLIDGSTLFGYQNWQFRVVAAKDDSYMSPIRRLNDNGIGMVVPLVGSSLPPRQE